MNEFKIHRAIISVWDKTGILPLSQLLESRGIEIFSTGGTFTKLKEAGIRVTKIEELTHFPEILGGRVKTLHPAVFAGILADVRDPSHVADLESASVQPFQMVVVNLYPFSETYHSVEKTPDQIVEMIDVGGPSMIRAASKNYHNVVVLSRPNQYDEFRERLEKNEITTEYRRSLAAEVFAGTARYDAEIADFFQGEKPSSAPSRLMLDFAKLRSLRYGENPDQAAAIYAPTGNPNWEAFHQLQGKEISYNNYIDCMAVYRIISDFDVSTPACAIVKHTNPCGFGLGHTLSDAYKRAVQTDPVSYFGGIVGVNQSIDENLAEELVKTFLECIVAPSYSKKALGVLSKKKNLRLLVPIQADLQCEWEFRNFGRGLVTQAIQIADENEAAWRVVTETKPPTQTMASIRLGWKLVRHVKSNAIVLCDESGTVGIGAGQMSRIESLKISIGKAEEAGLSATGSTLASDAFFPFRDSADLASRYGIAGIIQPGGSIHDQEVIDACNEHGMFMIFTGKRVFKH
ncbi:MAG: bifunctional phosphoribosylaminoimidazolecarboxamide formyltransferase/inosine monophosphate cyclohydrolase [Candidatus Marinimicrobia bacterium CG08_land_8_20_14_0_20_45_22]|nr:MAG: bifunctional phosphoribosylaminoimidazolecarboxamide formyltransferase/inosine monophosphate cyclohydrolase [Candidatus Marinimicrobia bacterium CG08_land_8_20_14_0_20_45_22]